jgi:anti-anti-sigma factor
MVDLSPSPVAATTLHVEHLNDATLVTLTRGDLGNEEARAVGDRLSRLAETLGRHHFVLSLRGVPGLSSVTLGKLISFHKRVKQAGGQLTLCSLASELSARFQGMRLDRLFHICPTEVEALGGQR